MKKIKRPMFIHALSGSLILIFLNRNKKKKTSPPQKINNYVLIEKLAKNDNEHILSNGIYQKDNKKYIIKTWHGKIKDLTYYFLINEFLANTILFKHFKSDIKIPKLIEIYSSQDKTSIIFEYIKGRTLDKYNIEYQAKIIDKIYKHLYKISPLLKKEEEKILIKRKFTKYLSLYSFFIPLLIIMKPSFLSIALKAYKSGISETEKVDKKRMILAHSDLVPRNIIISDNHIYLIDLENLSLTIPGYDYTLLNVLPDLNNLRNKLETKYHYKINKFLSYYLSLQITLGSDKLWGLNERYLQIFKEQLYEK